MTYIKSFRELEVYILARELAKEIYEISKDFPKEEIYSLTSQIRRSSRSVGAQIAEAWGKRRYIKHFESKLTDADAEQLETQHWIETSLDHNYITQEVAQNLMKRYETLGKQIGSMISKSDSFCGKLQ
jgi:four helix bundle protein